MINSRSRLHNNNNNNNVEFSPSSRIPTWSRRPNPMLRQWNHRIMDAFKVWKRISKERSVFHLEENDTVQERVEWRLYLSAKERKLIELDPSCVSDEYAESNEPHGHVQQRIQKGTNHKSSQPLPLTWPHAGTRCLWNFNRDSIRNSVKWKVTGMKTIYLRKEGKLIKLDQYCVYDEYTSLTSNIKHMDMSKKVHDPAGTRRL